MSNTHKINKIATDIYNECPNKKLVNKYQIIKTIGSGSFGEVYLAKCVKTGKYLAAKVEDRTKAPKIVNEYKIYMALYKSGFNSGLPKIDNIIQTQKYNIMFMQLLGPNLEDLFNKNNRLFDVPTVLLLGIQMVTLLERLHKTKYIHRDIKPNNFLIGTNTNKDHLYIMDFGLSKKFVDKFNNHIEQRNNRSLIGTARYASINMHQGIEPSRRDDLESVGYMLVYFLKGGLPWQGAKKKAGRTHIECIGDIKNSTHLDVLCENIPECFKEYIILTRSIDFSGEPDYDKLRQLFTNYQNSNQIDLRYQWC